MTDKLILLDTTIIVDYLRGDSQTVLFFNNLQNTPVISLITEAEIYQGARNAYEIKKWEKVISNLKVLPINSEISVLALNIVKSFHLSHSLHILDALIAASAIEN